MKKLILALLVSAPACYAAQQDAKELAALTDRMAALQQIQGLPLEMVNAQDPTTGDKWYSPEQLMQANAQKIEANQEAFALAPRLLALAKESNETPSVQDMAAYVNTLYLYAQAPNIMVPSSGQLTEKQFKKLQGLATQATQMFIQIGPDAIKWPFQSQAASSSTLKKMED